MKNNSGEMNKVNRTSPMRNNTTITIIIERKPEGKLGRERLGQLYTKQKIMFVVGKGSRTKINRFRRKLNGTP